jgi:hypothetical protein
MSRCAKIGFRAGLVVALALLVAWMLAHVECTTTEPAPVMLAVEQYLCIDVKNRVPRRTHAWAAQGRVHGDARDGKCRKWL